MIDFEVERKMDEKERGEKGVRECGGVMVQ